LTGIEQDAFLTLDVKITKERAVPTRESEEGGGCGDSDVHADHTTLNLLGELASGRAAGSKNDRPIAVAVLVGPLNRFLQVLWPEH